MSTIAGHSLSPTQPRTCSCGRTWDDLVAKRHRWVEGEPGIAHIGILNASEVSELWGELFRIYDLVMGRRAA